MGDVAIQASGLGKSYKLGLSAALRHRCARACRKERGGTAGRLAGRGERREVDVLWALRDVSFADPERRSRRPDRPQRRRQEHAAEDPLADHRADHRLGRGHRPGRLAARGRHRLPPGADRARERLPQRRDPRHAPRRDPQALRRDRRLRRHRALPRHPGEALLERHVRCGSPSPSPPTSSRRSCSSTRCSRSATPPSSASRWRRWPRWPGRGGRSSSSPTTWRRSRRSASAASCSSAAGRLPTLRSRRRSTSYLRALERSASEDLLDRTDRDGRGWKESRVRRLGVYDAESGQADVVVGGPPGEDRGRADRGAADDGVPADDPQQPRPPVDDARQRALGAGRRRATPGWAADRVRIDSLPLVPGRYRIDVLLKGRQEIQDGLQAAAFFDVEPGVIERAADAGGGRPTATSSCRIAGCFRPKRTGRPQWADARAGARPCCNAAAGGGPVAPDRSRGTLDRRPRQPPDRPERRRRSPARGQPLRRRVRMRGRGRDLRRPDRSGLDRDDEELAHQRGQAAAERELLAGRRRGRSGPQRRRLPERDSRVRVRARAGRPLRDPRPALGGAAVRTGLRPARAARRRRRSRPSGSRWRRNTAPTAACSSTSTTSPTTSTGPAGRSPASSTTTGWAGTRRSACRNCSPPCAQPAPASRCCSAGSIGRATSAAGSATARSTPPTLSSRRNHTYDFSACGRRCRDTLARIARRFPVVTGELGEGDCRRRYVNSYMDWADRHGISYLGWAWNTGGRWDCGGGPSLIESYDGHPTRYGAGLRKHLRRIAASERR